MLFRAKIKARFVSSTSYFVVLAFAPQPLAHSATVVCPHSVSVLLRLCFASFSVGQLVCNFDHCHLNAEIQKAPMINHSSSVMPTLVDAPEERGDHDCVELSTPYPVFQDIPLDNADLISLTDGSSAHIDGLSCKQPWNTTLWCLTSLLFMQHADLVALTEACKCDLVKPFWSYASVGK